MAQQSIGHFPKPYGNIKPNRLLSLSLLAALAFSPYMQKLYAQTTERMVQNATQPDGKRYYISGVVVDENNQPVPGALLSIKESNRKGLTNLDGSFNLWLDAHEKTLVVASLGMKSQTHEVQNRTDWRIQLLPDEINLAGVVVTGYQTLSKERATGAFDIVNPGDLKGKLQTDVVSRLEGQAAGLVQQKGNFFVRGIATLRGGAEGYKPLIVVDGLPFEGDLESIHPATIKNVTILKDAAAASIYGARAANGVIVVSTIEGDNKGKTSVTYDATIKFTPKTDFSHLNRLSTSELVDLQVYGFQFNRGTYENLPPREFVNPVLEQLYRHKSGLISHEELQTALNGFRKLDNRRQLEDFYTRIGIMNQHNLSISGGNERNRYALTLNYLSDKLTTKYQSEKRYGFTLRDNLKFFNWLSADLGVAGSFTRSKGDNGMGSYYDAYTSYPSYYMLYDTNGNILNLPTNKSTAELERLKSIGLNDETYSPITNRAQQQYRNNENYYRVQAGVKVKFTDYLNLDVKFQSENKSLKNEQEYGKNSYFVRKMVNNAAQYDSNTDELTLNVPQGGQLNQTRGDVQSYTFRTQLNFIKETGRHFVTAIAGAERRQVKSTASSIYHMGYDHNSLGFKPINPLILNPLSGTESLSGNFSWVSTDYNYLYEREDRYVSFYANASYSLDSKYDLTGSLRIDQSNLFGTDPKYQYRPLWSLGGSWHAHKEKVFQNQRSWLDKLSFRLTYGIGGNVPKDAGPYLTLKALRYNSWLNEFGSSIKNPANPTLRWEKTGTLNFGIDFAIFAHRLSGSIDLYNKRTNDLLANRNADPTLGWSQVMLNYGSMYNRGIEVKLHSRNIETKDFRWTSALTFSYNKNKLTNVEDADATVFNYTNGYASVKGYPLGAVFSHRYAGLSGENGKPLYYTKDGAETTAYIDNIDDLVYSGTRIPRFTSSLTNTLSYKSFDLSFMFVYYGGHVLRNEAAPYLATAPTTNINREILNAWRQPGDELRNGVTPAITGSRLNTDNDLHPWYSADTHVIKGDYIKLRDISLTYNFDRNLVGRWGFSALNVTLQVQNLLTWKANDKGVDPESMTTTGYGWGSIGFKVPTTWSFGVSAQF